MNSIKRKMSLTLTIVLMATGVFAQQIDQARMDRDLAVAEDILTSLIKNESEGVQFFRTRASSAYLVDYGVIFNISGSGHMIGEDFDSDFVFSFDGEDLADFDYVYQHNSDEYEEHEEHEEHEQHRRHNGVNVRVHEKKVEEEIKKMSERKEQEVAKGTEIIKNAMKTFLTDYADLIGQLRPDHKIMISSSGNEWNFGPIHVGSGSGTKVSAEVTRKDISDYKTGKLSREQLMERVVITQSEKNAKKETDLELLTSIFRRLYQPDLSDTYYLADRLSYERLLNFGVIYKMRMYSSSSDRGGRHTITTLGISGLTDEERNEKVVELYPKFEKDLKENLLEYGKTVRSLPEDEILMLKVKLTQCKGCDMPKSIDVSVKQTVLSDYASGKLTKSAALSRINVKQHED